MNIYNFLLELNQKGIIWQLADNKLKLNGDRSVLTEELITKIQKHKGDIIRYISSGSTYLSEDDYSEIILVERTKNSIFQDFPASFAQQRLWILEQLAQSTGAYNIPLTMLIKGLLHKDSFIQAIKILITRHDSLRTCFQNVNDNIVQRIYSKEYVNFYPSYIDLSNFEYDDAYARAKEFFSKEVVVPFDLKTAPLLRCYIITLPKLNGISTFAIAIVFHHIITDGWSNSIFLTELSDIYNAICTNKKNSLANPTIQYPDYSVWQHNQFKKEKFNKNLNYWKSQLADLSSLNFPCDYERPLVQRFDGKRIDFTIDNKITSKVRKIAEALGTTAFVVILTVFDILLAHYTSQEDIAVGIPSAGRNHKDIENIIGFFINTLVIKTDLSGNPSFGELIKRNHSIVINAQANQDAPFDKIIEYVNPERNQSRSPLFEVMFVYQNYAKGNFKLLDAEVVDFAIDYNIAKFDLTLFIEDLSDHLSACLEFNSSLFKPSTAKRLVEHFNNLLNQLINNLEESVFSVCLLSQAERKTIVKSWNKTGKKFYYENSIHQTFERQVLKNGSKIALRFGQKAVTYEELNYSVNQLARYLIKNNVQREQCVAICLERSIEMIIAVLAVIKTGAAFLPIDINYPLNRKKYIIEDSRAVCIIASNDKQLIKIAEENCAKYINMINDAIFIAQESGANIDLQFDTKKLIYVIYTSGSTGKPKGVLIEERGLINYINWANEYYTSLKPADTLLFTSLAFDLTITSIFIPLTSGGSITILPEDNPLIQLADILKNKDNHFSFIKLTPAHLDYLNVLLQNEANHNVVDVVIVGGDALYNEQVVNWHKFSKNSLIVNEYGPTETVVGCTVFSCGSNDQLTVRTVPIGKPIANTQIYILDKYLNPVPINVIGEIYIGGVGVARGYLNQSDLTHTKFVKNPFSIHNEYMYRTGDLARWLESGDIEYIARIDSQTKIRGYRIDLTEIESCLCKYPQIQQSAVVIKGDKNNGTNIVAYVVPRNNCSLDEGQILNYLKDNLPIYMLPARIILLNKLPLTTNGKIDKEALPEINYSSVTDETKISPSTPTEKLLVELWSRILKIDPSLMSIHDNFFYIGGNSIKSIQFITVSKQYGLSLNPNHIFKHQTIYYLAKAIDADPSLKSDSGILNDKGGQYISSEFDKLKEVIISPIKPINKSAVGKIPFFCMHPGGGTVQCYQKLAKLLPADQPFYGLQDPSMMEERRYFASIQEMAACYKLAIEDLQKEGPYILGGWSMGGTVAYEIAHQLLKESKEVGYVILFDAWLLNDADLENEQLTENEYRNLLGEEAKILAEPTIKQMYFSTQKRNLIFKEYTYKHIDVPLILFKSQAFRPESPLKKFSSAVNKWNEVYKGNIQVIDVPGDHDSMMESPNVERLAEYFSLVLSQDNNFKMKTK